MRHGGVRKKQLQYQTGATKGTFKKGEEEEKKGRGRKEQSQYTTKGLPKELLKGGEEEVRNVFLIALVPFCRTLVRFSMDCAFFIKKH